MPYGSDVASKRSFADSLRERGLECPQCGCRHWLTLFTRHIDKRVRRRRQCRHCGYQADTFEEMKTPQETEKPQQQDEGDPPIDPLLRRP